MIPVGIRETLRHAIAKLVMRVAEDQVKTVCGSLHLCAGLEAGIEGANHVVASRRSEQHTPYSGCEADEASEGAADESAADTSGTEKSGGTETVGGIGELPRPPRERSTIEEGEGAMGGVNNELRTTMGEMEEGGEDMDEGEEAEVERDVAEAEEGGSEGGGCWNWKPQGYRPRMLIQAAQSSLMPAIASTISSV